MSFSGTPPSARSLTVSTTLVGGTQLFKELCFGHGHLFVPLSLLEDQACPGRTGRVRGLPASPHSHTLLFNTSERDFLRLVPFASQLDSNVPVEQPSEDSVVLLGDRSRFNWTSWFCQACAVCLFATCSGSSCPRLPTLPYCVKNDLM